MTYPHSSTITHADASHYWRRHYPHHPILIKPIKLLSRVRIARRQRLLQTRAMGHLEEFTRRSQNQVSQIPEMVKHKHSQCQFTNLSQRVWIYFFCGLALDWVMILI